MHVHLEDLVHDPRDAQAHLARALGLQPPDETASRAAIEIANARQTRVCSLRVANYHDVRKALRNASLHGCNECKAMVEF